MHVARPGLHHVRGLLARIAFSRLRQFCRRPGYFSSGLAGQKGKCFPFWFLRFAGLDGQIRKCLRIWSLRVVSSARLAAIHCTTSNFLRRLQQSLKPYSSCWRVSPSACGNFATSRGVLRVRWARTKVLSFLVRTDRRLGWANRKVLPLLVSSDRRLGGKLESAFQFESTESSAWHGKFASACEFGSVETQAWTGQKGKCFPF